MTQSKFDVITNDEREEAASSGIGIMSADSSQGLQAYRLQLIQTLINVATLQLSGLSRRELAKVTTDQLSTVFGRMVNDSVEVLEAKLNAIMQEHGPELVALAMRNVDKFGLKRGVDDSVVVERRDPSLVTPYGSYVTREEAEQLMGDAA